MSVLYCATLGVFCSAWPARTLIGICRLLVGVFATFFALPGATAAVSSAEPRAMTTSVQTLSEVRTRVAGLAVPWVANAGQWDHRAAWRAQSFAGAVWLTTDGALVHVFNGPSETVCDRFEGAIGDDRTTPRPRRCERAPAWVIVERFVGGRVGAAVPRDAVEGRVSYQVGPEQRHAGGLAAYARLDLGEIYPGIGIELGAVHANVEKLYTVAPGGDAGQIRMRLEGATELRLAADGALEALTGHGPIRFTAPVAFQSDARRERQAVDVRYVLHPNACGPHCHEYGFALGPHDRSRAVTIDPLLQSTYHGGGGNDIAYAVAIHPQSGEVYAAGVTTSNDLPSVTGGAQSIKGVGEDAFVTRFNPSLTARLQSTYVGGGGSDGALALAIHAQSGEVYVAGRTTSSDLPGVAGGAQSAKATGEDGFVTRFNSALSVRHQTTYLGGDADDRALALAIHPLTGEIYVAGYTSSSDLPGAVGGAQSAKSGGEDAFATRFNAALTVRFQSTYFGGSADDRAHAIGIHPFSGEVYVTGSTGSSDLPGVTGGAQLAKAALDDAYVARFNSTLTALGQSTYLGGAGFDIAHAFAVHPVSGEIYLAGSTTSGDLPAVAGGAQPVKGALNDAFVSRLNAALTSILQATYLGGSSQDYALALAIHPLSGDVYVAGYTTSTDLPGAAAGAQAVYGGGSVDAFLTRFNAALSTRLQSTYLGGEGNDFAWAIGVHPASVEIVVTGQTGSTAFPATAGGAQATRASSTDAFLSRLSADLRAADVTPDPFVLPAQFGVPVATLRTAGPVQITGIAASAPVTVDGALGSAVCVSSASACACDLSPGSDFGPTANIGNGQYLCVRHLSAPTIATYAESRVVVGGFATKFSTFTGTLAGCSLDMDGDNLVTAPKEGLVIARALLGFAPAEAVVGTGITQAQWDTRRAALAACGIVF